MEFIANHKLKQAIEPNDEKRHDHISGKELMPWSTGLVNQPLSNAWTEYYHWSTYLSRAMGKEVCLKKSRSQSMNMRLNMPYYSILQIYPDQIIFIITLHAHQEHPEMKIA